jgi:hypothetical protein
MMRRVLGLAAEVRGFSRVPARRASALVGFSDRSLMAAPSAPVKTSKADGGSVGVTGQVLKETKRLLK